MFNPPPKMLGLVAPNMSVMSTVNDASTCSTILLRYI